MNNAKKYRKTIEWETRDLLKKIRDTERTFHARKSTIKDSSCKDILEVEEINKRWEEYTEGLYKRKVLIT